jgi:hypothetical protein
MLTGVLAGTVDGMSFLLLQTGVVINVPTW